MYAWVFTYPHTSVYLFMQCHTHGVLGVQGTHTFVQEVCSPCFPGTTACHAPGAVAPTGDAAGMCAHLGQQSQVTGVCSNNQFVALPNIESVKGFGPCPCDALAKTGKRFDHSVPMCWLLCTLLAGLLACQVVSNNRGRFFEPEWRGMGVCSIVE
jgi:hypothetical protein